MIQRNPDRCVTERAATRVLIVPGTTEIALEIRRSLRLVKGIELFGAGTDVTLGHDLGFLAYDFLPPFSDEEWLPTLRALCERFQIDYVYPAHDSAVSAIARLSSRIGAKVVSHPPDTASTCRSKRKTSNLLRGCCPTPRIFDSTQDISTFPVIAKPDVGQGSVGVRLIKNGAVLKQAIEDSGLTEAEYFADYVVSEYLPGAEVTVDCFSTIGDGLLLAQPRERRETVGGIASHTEDIHSPELVNVAQAINSVMAFSGAWFFQARQDGKGTFKVLEVGARLAGSSGIRRAQGINLAHLSLLVAQGVPVSVPQPTQRLRSRRVLAEQFHGLPAVKRVYVDLDDTLLLDTGLNHELLAFLYMMRSKQVQVILLTKHLGDLPGLLREHRIAEVFDDVVQLSSHQKKGDFIDGTAPAMLIDDSFKERMSASQLGNVYAVEPSAVSGMWGI